MPYPIPHWSQRGLQNDQPTSGRSQNPSTDAATGSELSKNDKNLIDAGKLYTTAEAAHMLRISPRTAERMRVEGGGPPFIKLGNGSRARVVYSGADLLAWIENQKRSSTSEHGR